MTRVENDAPAQRL